MAPRSTILIVEDDADTRDVVSRLLSRTGYCVRTAANGWEGLLACDTPVDLILLDMMMPGMDGPAFLKVLRGKLPGNDPPVVVMTALQRDEVERKVRPYGVTAILFKDGKLYPELKALVKQTLATPERQARAMPSEP